MERKGSDTSDWICMGCCNFLLLNKMGGFELIISESYFLPLHCERPKGQRVLFRQVMQRGLTGLHNCWPNPTIKLFTSSHSSVGSHDSNAARVASGVLVAFGTQPSLFEILWTCVSTPESITRIQ